MKPLSSNYIDNQRYFDHSIVAIYTKNVKETEILFDNIEAIDGIWSIIKIPNLMRRAPDIENCRLVATGRPVELSFDGFTSERFRFLSEATR
ncbi:unnamed protein product [Didymodactylos carnosus]|uniref:Uncharacterized protein n=1 Tax=Didymodactylos carnosus TaxID=1234261 RepID=A0A814WY61_9BILA|nr:unnamed protein product [Didymodactylos carnosus]CAF1208660.1 unnamed protein product [Didymodactylos carnosus]CAF3786053.1 unnamed protein product [Didymodactylos carnosus]CAF3972847.1 unnamed protein product [Didymodactylos carnosus]